MTSQFASLIPAVPSVVSALASLLTVWIAVRVFAETKRIRQIEWIHTTNAVWNDFNKIVLNSENHKDWMEFLNGGSESFATYRLENRINWILYIYLNALNTTIHAMEVKSSDRAFHKRTLEAEFELIFLRRVYVVEFFRVGGYGPILQKYFSSYCDLVQKFLDEGHHSR